MTGRFMNARQLAGRFAALGDDTRPRFGPHQCILAVQSYCKISGGPSEARCRRQILPVTHNLNLAVVCDADQVIHATLDAESANRRSYQSGATENPAISAAIVDVLEGTKPAFEKREHKYVAAMPDWLL
jgi:hypothetical protein